MKFFEEVTPVKLKCSCGIVTESDKKTNREIFKMVNSSNDTLFIGLQCGHNPELSNCILTDKNNNVIQKMTKEKVGTFQYFVLKIYLFMISLNLSWNIPQWFCPVWCECASLRFFLLWMVGTFLIAHFINPFIGLYWMVGFPIFGFILAAMLGVFNHD